MALPGGANRIDGAMSAVVLSLPAGARTPRANRINEWPVPNQSGRPTVHRYGSRPAGPVPGEGVVKDDARRGSGMDQRFRTGSA